MKLDQSVDNKNTIRSVCCPTTELWLGQRILSLQLDRRGEFVATYLANHRTVTQVMVHRVLDGKEVFSYSGKDTIAIGFHPGTDRFYLLTSGDENQLRFFDRDTWQES